MIENAMTEEAWWLKYVLLSNFHIYGSEGFSQRAETVAITISLFSFLTATRYKYRQEAFIGSALSSALDPLTLSIVFAIVFTSIGLQGQSWIHCLPRLLIMIGMISTEKAFGSQATLCLNVHGKDGNNIPNSEFMQMHFLG